MKILYAINGDGLGHTTRSIPIIRYLLKKHDLKITISSKRSYDFIKNKFKDIYFYDGLKLFYRNNNLRIMKTTFYNLDLMLFTKMYSNIRDILSDFNPDVLITDCDHSFTKVASQMNISVICICNIHALSEMKLDVELRDKFNLKITNVPSNLFSKNINYHIITTFFKHPLLDNSKKNKFISDPVIREEISNSKSEYNNYYLIYQTSNTNSALLHIIRKKYYSKYKFIIYGFDTSISKSYRSNKNIVFKSVNDKEFFKDLLGCNACITNGGHTLITEAIYLKKPLLCIPVSSQYEQKLNAIEVERLGYGLMCEKIDDATFIKFLDNINLYKKNLKNVPKWNNAILFKKLDNLLNKFDV